jgi:hypothetical protein
MSSAGYSGTPLPRKLGIREGSRVLLVSAPEGFAAVLGELPGGDVVRELGLAAGLVDDKVCAIDAAWSALRFARRLRDRPSRSGVSG